MSDLICESFETNELNALHFTYWPNGLALAPGYRDRPLPDLFGSLGPVCVGVCSSNSLASAAATAASVLSYFFF